MDQAPSAGDDNAMDEIVAEFVIESEENLDRIDQDLLALERHPTDEQLLAGIFRTWHTIKGTCGFLEFERLERVAHSAETLLTDIRSHRLAVDAFVISELLEAVDVVRTMLKSIRQTGTEGRVDPDEVIHKLTLLREGDPTLVGPPAAADDSDTQGRIPRAPDIAGLRRDPPTDPLPVSMEPAGTTIDTERGAQLGESTLRVDIELVDRMLNTVGELVLARNHLLQTIGPDGDPEVLLASQKVGALSSELQDYVMAARMQPVRRLFSRVPRLARDVAVASGKQITVHLEGEETELDRALLDGLADPILHLVRNAVGHGIESPQARARAGKPAAGHLVLRAFHKDGLVMLELSDDGAGIDLESVRARAVQRGLISASEAQALDDPSAMNLLFLPGFSTATEVTTISGRGVGLDVVKTNIEELGGRVAISTEQGQGTVFSIALPLTLAIIPAVVVATARQRFVIPQANLVEVARLNDDSAGTRLHEVVGARLFPFRGVFIPALSLARTLDVPGDEDHAVILHAEGRDFALIVESIVDIEEVVVKPLEVRLKNIDVYSAVTILGNGEIAMILDPAGLARRISSSSQRAVVPEPPEAPVASKTKDFLIVESGEEAVGIPVPSIVRVEEIRPPQLEPSGTDFVFQSLGEMITVREIVGSGDVHCSAEKRVVVIVEKDRVRTGLLADRVSLGVVGVEAGTISTDRAYLEAEIAGHAVVGNRVTTMLGIPAPAEDANSHE